MDRNGFQCIFSGDLVSMYWGVYINCLSTLYETATATVILFGIGFVAGYSANFDQATLKELLTNLKEDM